MPEDKRIAVINSAYACFGKNGYKKTSIADIAKQADVSKALIFHYFDTKKNLYKYIIDFGIEKLLEIMTWETEDYFQLIEEAMNKKAKIMSEFPGLFEFSLSLINESDEEVVDMLKELFENNAFEEYMKMFENIRWDKFKPEFDKKTIMSITKWITDGYINSEINNKTFEQMQADIIKYLKLLKQFFYKEEYL